MIRKPIMDLFDMGLALFRGAEGGDPEQGFAGESFKH